MLSTIAGNHDPSVSGARIPRGRAACRHSSGRSAGSVRLRTVQIVQHALAGCALSGGVVQAGRVFRAEPDEPARVAGLVVIRVRGAMRVARLQPSNRSSASKARFHRDPVLRPPADGHAKPRARRRRDCLATGNGTRRNYNRVLPSPERLFGSGI